jgi:CRP-like cAMP-binding protein
MGQLARSFALGNATTGLFARNRLLAKLPPAAYALLAPHLVETRLEKDSRLAEPGQPIEFVYFPHGGIISLTGLSAQGHRVETAAVGREGGLGLTAGFGPRISFAGACVQLPARAAKISAERFADAVSHSTSLREMIIGYGDVLAAQLHQSALCIGGHKIQDRLCRWLLHARDRVGDEPLVLTQESLAAILGVRRTTVSVICHNLQTEGALQFRRGVIKIEDVDALESKACSCYRHLRQLIDGMSGERER